MERKKQAFSLQKPYFQPYSLNKTTLVARKEPPPPQTLLTLLFFQSKNGGRIRLIRLRVVIACPLATKVVLFGK